MLQLVDRISAVLGLKRWVFIVGLVVALTGSFGVAKCAYDRAVVTKTVTKANQKTLKKQINANDAAAADRVKDAKAADQLEREYDNAINRPAICDPVSARKRLACERLRAAGHREADLPASCRCAGSGR